MRACVVSWQLGGFSSVVELLLQKGAKVDGVGSGHDVGTPLHAAANGGHHVVLSLLLTHGADIKATGLMGSTALHFAAAGGHASAVELLLLAGAERSVSLSETGDTPMNLAQKAQIEALKVTSTDKANSAEFKEVIRLLQHPSNVQKMTPAETQADSTEYQAETNAAWREVVDSTRQTYGYWLLMRIGRRFGNCRTVLYATLVGLFSIVVGAALLLPSSTTTAYTMIGLNAGIVHATELDRDGQPTRIALGIQYGTASSSKSLPMLGELLSSYSVMDTKLLAVYAWYVVLSISSVVSKR